MYLAQDLTVEGKHLLDAKGAAISDAGPSQQGELLDWGQYMQAATMSGLPPHFAA